MLARSSFLVRRQRRAFAGPVLTQQRFVEYWGIGVTARTQPYARGDKLPTLDNTRFGADKPSSAAASLTGNQTNVAYDSSNIFSVKDFSVVERDHYVPLRGLTKHKIDPIPEKDGPATAKIIEELLEKDVEASLQDLWWSRLLQDFPSLKKPCTPAFRKEWEQFYIATLNVAHKEEEVRKIAAPFLREQMQKKYISYAMVWRIAERLADALEAAPFLSRYESKTSRPAVERVTKIMLDTIADEPWSHQDATNPLLVDISNFRAWHEAGNW